MNTEQKEAGLASDLNNELGIKKALHTAISALYFDDSSDYKSSLYEIIKLLGGDEAVQLFEQNPHQAFHVYDA